MRGLIGPVRQPEMAAVRRRGHLCRQHDAFGDILVLDLEVCPQFVERAIGHRHVLAILVGLRGGVEREDIGQPDSNLGAEAQPGEFLVPGRAGADRIGAVLRHNDSLEHSATRRRRINAKRGSLRSHQPETVVVGVLHRQIVLERYTVQRTAFRHVDLGINACIHRLVGSRPKLLVGDLQGFDLHLRRLRAAHLVVRGGFHLHHAGFGIHPDDRPLQVDLQLLARLAVEHLVGAERNAAVGFQGALERDAVVVIVIVLDARHHDSAHLHVLRHGVVAVGGQFPQIGDREIPLGRRRSLHEGQLLHDRGIPFGRNAYRQRTGAGSIVFGNGHRHGRHARGLGLREFGPRGVVARDGDRPVAVGLDVERERRGERRRENRVRVQRYPLHRQRHVVLARPGRKQQREGRRRSEKAV